MLDSLDADAVRRWCATGLLALRRHQREIDELNVYPVPDGDTGTNLVLTFVSAQEKLLATEPGDLPATVTAFARGALLGARGNSGLIVSQLLDGFAGTLTASSADGRALAIGLTAATNAAYRAVADPVEGTILSVARGAALAATAVDSDDLVRVARAAVTGAVEALARTPDQLAELARAGVVDAGGRGLVVLLEALVEVITGEAAPVTEAPEVSDHQHHHPVVRETGSEEFAFEVQFLLDASSVATDALRATLATLGDSLVVVGLGPMEPDATVPTWNVHVHVNDIGAVMEAAVLAGRPHRISVTHFATQIAASRASEIPPAEPVRPAVRVDPSQPVRATVVVATGDGLAALFAAEGAAVVPGPNPSTEEILAAIRSTGATRVVVLPNIASTQAVASAAAAEARTEGIRVSVVPTRSPVQALAALAIRDTARRFDDDVIAMAEAAGACRYAEVTLASREALTVAGRCQPGDVLALVEGEVNLIGSDLAATCRDLLDRLLAGGGELVTMLTGAQAPADLAEDLRAHLARRWPFVEVQVYDGGQPLHPLLVGVE